MSVLTVGDKVNWRGTWGKDSPKEVTVASIEVNCHLGNGVNVDSVDWSNVKSRSVVVDFIENDHWSYGNQLDKIN